MLMTIFRNVDGTSLMFISSHLTAHEGVKHCKQRNDSIAEILSSCRVSDTRFDAHLQVHHTFFNGDMNYRTTFDPSTPSMSEYEKESLQVAESDEETEVSESKDEEDIRDAQLQSTLELISQEKWCKLLFSNREVVDRSFLILFILGEKYCATMKPRGSFSREESCAASKV